MDTMEDVLEASQEAGDHWFEESTMRFFKTTIESELIYGRYFITSEVNPCGILRYSVRTVKFNEFGEYASIDTIGAFHSFDTMADGLKIINQEFKNS